MNDTQETERIVSAQRLIHAPAKVIFELIADPARQPEWDGNNNLDHAEPGQRVTGVGDVFTMSLTIGQDRDNHVVEFSEGTLIAWKPSLPGESPTGQLWRWEISEQGDGCLVTHTYDWTDLHDPNREKRARATTEENLAASLNFLAERAEAEAAA